MTPPELDSPGEQPDPPAAMQGLQVIERALATLPLSPGVYRMLDAKGAGKQETTEEPPPAYSGSTPPPEDDVPF